MVKETRVIFEIRAGKTQGISSGETFTNSIIVQRCTFSQLIGLILRLLFSS